MHGRKAFGQTPSRAKGQRQSQNPGQKQEGRSKQRPYERQIQSQELAGIFMNIW
jgi:hypothetical protein